MIKSWSKTSFILFAILLSSWACGLKRPPTLPQKAFTIKVINLRSEWIEEDLFLKADINGFEEADPEAGLVRGCRVYYRQYPLENPPCTGCPIDYAGYHEFGPEVVTAKGFSCRMPEMVKGEIYFFKVHLIGPDGAVGPPSNRIRVDVE